MSRFVRQLGCVLLSGLASCVVGPRYVPQSAGVPAAFSSAPQATPALSDSEPSTVWWQAFNDAELDRLESRTEHGNLNLQAGLVRIVSARTQVQTARAQGLPSLNATASYNREQLGLAGILKAQGGTGTLNPALVSALISPINLFQMGFDASWELDLFGKVSRSVEVAKAQSEEAVESRNDMLVSLEAEVAQTYLQLRAAQTLSSITRSLIAEEKEIFDLTSNRQAHGLAQETDVESLRAQASRLNADLPQFEQNVASARHALAVLVGENPQALDAELSESGELPVMPPVVSVGVPASLARRRPDIRQAEAALHAATAEIGVSLADVYPDVALKGSFGLRNISARYLTDWASKFYAAGPSISLPLFHGDALIANVKIARAEAAVATLTYRSTVLTALQEIEDGLVSLDQDRIRVAALSESLAADQRSLDITNHSYHLGLISYIGVLNQKLQVDQARQQFAQASLTQGTDLVKLYKALGGGWEHESDASRR